MDINKRYYEICAPGGYCKYILNTDVYVANNMVEYLEFLLSTYCGPVARMGKGRGVYRVLVGKPEGKRPLGDTGVDGRIILRRIFRRWDVVGMQWIELA
jgi:hypothetical protein